MRRTTKSVSIFIICFLFVTALFAQDFEFEPEEIEIKPRQDFFIGVGGIISLYSAFDYAYGGSLTLGYGTGVSYGLTLTWFTGSEEINTLEINFFLRFYLFGRNAYSGPYLQLMGGPAVFFQSGYFHFPAYIGEISGGLGFGWRFVLKDRWFIEPNVRGGYPYLIGGGITAGIRL